MQYKQPLTRGHVNRITELAAWASRKSLPVFSQWIMPDYIGFYGNEFPAQLANIYWAQEEMRQDGERPRVVINSPPQHGKSTATTAFILWLLMTRPGVRVIYATFSQQLAQRMMRSLRRLAVTPFCERAYPGAHFAMSGLPGGVSNLSLSNVLHDGHQSSSIRCVTVGGAITGESADWLIIDDPHKGRQDARSQLRRDVISDWLDSDAMTRLSEHSAVALICTRWHPNDLASKLIKDGAKVYAFPAIDADGHALFPRLHSIEFLNERKATMPPEHWQGLYQQQPVADSDRVFDVDDFRQYDPAHPPDYSDVRLFADTAMKAKESSDYSVIQTWGFTNMGAYLITQRRGKWDAVVLEQQVRAAWKQAKDTYGAKVSGFTIEDAASGTGIIQRLRYDNAIPVTPVTRNKDKYLRAVEAYPAIAGGNCFLPIGAAFMPELLSELAEFTPDDTHQHDDQIDPLIDALQYLLNRQSALARWGNII